MATGLGRKPVGYSVEMRRPAIRSTAHDPTLGGLDEGRGSVKGRCYKESWVYTGLEDGWLTEGAQWGTVDDRTSVGGGQGTETEGFLDRVLKARAGMKGGRGEEGVGGIG